MTADEFEALVRRLEGVAREHPARYRWRVVGLGLLGYAYVAAIVAGTVGLLVGTGYLATLGSGSAVFAKIGWLLIGLIYVVARGLWVRLTPPKGIPLDSSRAPALFETIRRVRRHMRAPSVHRVLLVDEFNAAVSQVPRLGVLGWQKNHLVLGLPLLQALPSEQFEAVLAHEFGHLSGAHGRLGGWIYRARAGWSRLVERMEAEEHWGTFLFRPFFRWYAPYFAAYSFVQARAQEYEADRGGAEVAGARAMGDALLNLSIRGDHLQGGFWPALLQQADQRPEPDVAPFTAMGRTLAGELPEPTARASLQQALRRETTLDDTHPCLAERLAALGVEPRIPPPAPTSAAEVLLGEALPPLAEALDRSWRERIREDWRRRFEQVRQARARLTALDEKRSTGELELDEAYQRAVLREEFGGVEPPLALYREVLERAPDHAGARFAVGRLLLARDQADGLTHLDAAMRADEEAVLPGCELAYGFLQRHERAAEAERYRERAIAQHEKRERAAAERASLELDGRYLPHALEAPALARLRAGLAAHDRVVRAYLVRRDVELYPERLLFVLGVQQKRSLFGQKGRDLALQQELVDSLPLPGECFVLVLNHRPGRQRRLFTDVPGSQILP